ncbi:PQQ-binding-like beta-propeller repeat protein [Candidatus Poribacteria bacterium]|nr:PQQ-binding-like beta-propeller repeat protein [Candidatus Poribacteria bacterium]
MRKIFILFLIIIVITGCGREKPKEQAEQTKTEVKKENVISNSTITELSSEWPMFMRDISYSGNSPDKILHPPLSVAWKFKTGGPISSSPIIANNTIYIGSENNILYALDAAKWGVKWKFKASGRIIVAPTFDEGKIFFSSTDSKIYALDASNGSKIWDYQVEGWINSPMVVYRQRLYAGSYRNKIHIINSNNGDGISVERSSVKIGGTTYICSQGEFYPAEPRYEANKWRKLIPPSESWPVKANGFVYIGARDNKLRAFSQEREVKIWDYETDGWVDSAPAVANGMLYIGSRDGYVYAFANEASVKNQVLDDKDKGVITQDEARVYSTLEDNANIKVQLNEGRELKILEKRDNNWYKILLPNDDTGWMSSTDFIPIIWSEDLQLNHALVRNLSILNLPEKAEKPSWSPDGSSIAYFDNIQSQSIYWKARSVWVTSGKDGDPKWIADGAFFNPRLSWSGNGNWLTIENLAYNERQIWMVRSNATGLRKVSNGEAPSMSPKGDKIAFIRRNSSRTAVWIHQLFDEREFKIAEFPIMGQDSYAAYGYIADMDLPEWSPNGYFLAVGLDGYHYTDNYARIAVINISTGEVVREIAVRAKRIRNIEWSPNGHNIAYVSHIHTDKNINRRLDKHVNMADFDQPGSEMVFEHSEGISWSPNGKYLAFIAENDCMGLRKKVWLLNPENWQKVQLTATKEDITRTNWLGDNRIALMSSPKSSKNGPKTRGWILSIWNLMH